MKKHSGDLPCLRLRCAGYRLLSKLREGPSGVEAYTSEIREADRSQASKTYIWVKGYAGAWRLTVA